MTKETEDYFDFKISQPKGRVLNVGCGKDTYGTDRIDLYKTPSTTEVVNLDVDKFPYPDNTFIEIKMAGVLEHCKNLGHVTNEIYRVMKKGGKLYLRTDNAGCFLFHWSKWREHNNILKVLYPQDAFGHNQGEDAHFHLFVPSHLNLLFKQFSKVEVSYFTRGRNWFMTLFRKSMPYHMGAGQLDLVAIK